MSEGGEKDGGCGFWQQFGSKGEKRRGGNQENSKNRAKNEVGVKGGQRQKGEGESGARRI